MANIKFDENRFCCNHAELGRLCNRTFEQIVGKINRLRKEGVLEKPKKGTTSIKSKETMNRFNDARFAHIPKQKGDKPMLVDSTGTQELEQSISIESREVTLILTTTTINAQKVQQFFTKEGELLATKKLTPVAAEVSK